MIIGLGWMQSGRSVSPMTDFNRSTSRLCSRMKAVCDRSGAVQRHLVRLSQLHLQVQWVIVAVPDFAVALADLDRALSSIEAVVDPDRKRAEIADLEQQVAAPDLWDKPDHARRVTSRLSALQAEVDRLTGLRAQLEDIGILVELGEEEGDQA